MFQEATLSTKLIIYSMGVLVLLAFILYGIYTTKPVLGIPIREFLAQKYLNALALRAHVSLTNRSTLQEILCVFADALNDLDALEESSSIGFLLRSSDLNEALRALEAIENGQEVSWERSKPEAVLGVENSPKLIGSDLP